MLHRLWVAAVRRLALDRNPMRRRVDRAEAWLTALTVLLLLVAAPITGAHFAAQRQADQKARDRAAPTYRVKATVGAAARGGTSQMAGPASDRAARWTAPDGTPRSGRVVAPYSLRSGRTVTIWTDAHGRQQAPRSAKEMRADAWAYGGFVAGGVLLAGLGVVWAGRRLLDRRRSADWDAQWAQIAPHWMRQY